MSCIYNYECPKDKPCLNCKGHITDEMIKDLRDIMHSNLTMDCVKGKLKDRGYEIDEPKSKLEEAREYYEFLAESDKGTTFIDVSILKNKYESAVEELQEQLLEKDAEILTITRTKDTQSKVIDELQETIKQKDEEIKRLEAQIFDDTNELHNLKQWRQIDLNLCEWIRQVANGNIFYPLERNKKYAGELLKLLGIEN